MGIISSCLVDKYAAAVCHFLSLLSRRASPARHLATSPDFGIDSKAIMDIHQFVSSESYRDRVLSRRRRCDDTLPCGTEADIRHNTCMMMIVPTTFAHIM